MTAQENFCPILLAAATVKGNGLRERVLINPIKLEYNNKK